MLTPACPRVRTFAVLARLPLLLGVSRGDHGSASAGLPAVCRGGWRCSPDSTGGVQIWADPSKIERVMKWQARYTDVHESLRHAWDWRQRNPHGYPVSA